MMNSLNLKPDLKADSMLINKHERIKSVIESDFQKSIKSIELMH